MSQFQDDCIARLNEQVKQDQIIIKELSDQRDELVNTLEKLTKVCEQPDIYPNVRGHVALARAVLKKASPA
jgi:uncharacterized coiled-coil protein SlyX